MKENKEKRNSGKLFAVLFLIVIVAGIVYFMLPDNKPIENKTTGNPSVPSPGSAYTDSDHQLSIQFFTQLLKATYPNLPSNSHMPPALKDKLVWVYGENTKGTLDLVCTKQFEGMDAGAFMSAGFVENKPSIVVSGPRLFGQIKANGGKFPTITPEWVNFFAVGVAHEAMHLEKKGFLLKQSPSKEEVLQEELRVWFITAKFMIKPLVDQGQPVGDLKFADDALRQCGYELPCDSLRIYIKKLYNL